MRSVQAPEKPWEVLPLRWKITIRSFPGQRGYFYCLYSTKHHSIPITTYRIGINSGTRIGRNRHEREVRTVQNQPQITVELHSLQSWWSLLDMCWLDSSFYDRWIWQVEMSSGNNTVCKRSRVIYTVLKQFFLSMANNPIDLMIQWEEITLCIVFPGDLGVKTVPSI